MVEVSLSYDRFIRLSAGMGGAFQGSVVSRVVQAVSNNKAAKAAVSIFVIALVGSRKYAI
ncbi:hypothetical protein GCM10028786_32460 [Flaviaesturariibacter terrae]